MTKIEEVARAICEGSIFKMTVGGEQEPIEVVRARVDANWHHWRNHYLPVARAAIAALRDPSHEMKCNGRQFLPCTPGGVSNAAAEDVFNAMIDATLAEDK